MERLFEPPDDDLPPLLDLRVYEVGPPLEYFPALLTPQARLRDGVGGVFTEHDALLARIPAAQPVLHAPNVNPTLIGG
jgi:hypothetical protein